MAKKERGRMREREEAEIHKRKIIVSDWGKKRERERESEREKKRERGKQTEREERTKKGKKQRN